MNIQSIIRSSKRLIVAVGLLILFVGCSSTSETVQREGLTQNVGIYPPPPSGIAKPRVGIPAFSVKGPDSIAQSDDLNDIAADQMSSLLSAAERFEVIERVPLQKLLDGQKLEGMIAPGDMARPAKVEGVDYVLLGKVTNLRVKGENLNGADMKKDIRIITECGVDIRLVDPTTGITVMANFSKYKKTENADVIGLDILRVTGGEEAEIRIDADDKGKILRPVLDDALRKSLPKIDKFLASLAASTTTMSAPSAPVAAPVAAKKFCSECGNEVAPGAKFCGSCGAPLK